MTLNLAEEVAADPTATDPPLTVLTETNGVPVAEPILKASALFSGSIVLAPPVNSTSAGALNVNFVEDAVVVPKARPPPTSREKEGSRVTMVFPRRAQNV